MATELDEFYCAKLLAVRAMGRKGAGIFYTVVFPFELQNPLSHDVLFASISNDIHHFTKISTRTCTDIYKSYCPLPTEGTTMVRTASEIKIGEISRDVLRCSGNNDKQFLMQYVDNLCVNVYRCAGGTYGTHAATIVGNEANEVVVLNYMDIPMTLNEKILVLFSTLQIFKDHFGFEKKLMRFFLTYENELIRDNLLGFKHKKIWLTDTIFVRPYGCLSNQSKAVECFAEGGSVICTATWFISNSQFVQRVQRMTGRVISTSYSQDLNTIDGMIYTSNGSPIAKIKDEVIVIFHSEVPDMEVTRRKTGPKTYLIRKEDRRGEGQILARIFEGTGNYVTVELSQQLPHMARHGVMYIAIHFAITEFRIFDVVLPTVHHYPFASPT